MMALLTFTDKAAAQKYATDVDAAQGYPSSKPGTRYGKGPHADGGMVFTLREFDVIEKADGKAWAAPVCVAETAVPKPAAAVKVDKLDATWADAKPVKAEAAAEKPIEDGPVGEVAVKGK